MQQTARGSDGQVIGASDKGDVEFERIDGTGGAPVPLGCCPT